MLKDTSSVDEDVFLPTSRDLNWPPSNYRSNSLPVSHGCISAHEHRSARGSRFQTSTLPVASQPLLSPEPLTPERPWSLDPRGTAPTSALPLQRADIRNENIESEKSHFQKKNTIIQIGIFELGINSPPRRLHSPAGNTHSPAASATVSGAGEPTPYVLLKKSSSSKKQKAERFKDITDRVPADRLCSCRSGRHAHRSTQASYVWYSKHGAFGFKV